MRKKFLKLIAILTIQAIIILNISCFGIADALANFESTFKATVVSLDNLSPELTINIMGMQTVFTKFQRPDRLKSLINRLPFKNKKAKKVKNDSDLKKILKFVLMGEKAAEKIAVIILMSG